MNKTRFLKLALTAETEGALPFLDWRLLINGFGNGSNMELLDEALLNCSAVFDEDDGKNYTYRLVVQNGHLGIEMTEITD